MFSARSTKADAIPTVLPWVEKYRPKNVDEISHQEHVVATLKTSIASGQLPHLLFYGPPGTGKTSTIVAVARQLFGPDFRKNGRFLELNASDDRGISVVREKVKGFAQGAISGSSTMPPFKIIVLDEADSMTGDAQSALRRMMENYSKVTRFCLICNYVSRIIEPVASRCAKFRFAPLEKISMTARIQYICQEEHVESSDEVIDSLLECSNGDLRKAINFLQSAKQLCGNEPLSKDDVIAVAGLAPPELLELFWKSVASNNFDKMKVEIESILMAGYPVLTVLKQLSDDVLTNAKLSDTKKAKLCLRIAEADKKLVDGASEHFQLLDVASYIMRVYHSS
uniref:AAA+ ATPase domain-containing protein n=1 Tax=Globisporangium ultimum (strain ATCC 200006 / CBS 805.95 / DAOM BR144) TaxID=431595 RepID=K3W771_GLOUD